MKQLEWHKLYVFQPSVTAVAEVMPSAKVGAAPASQLKALSPDGSRHKANTSSLPLACRMTSWPLWRGPQVSYYQYI